MIQTFTVNDYYRLPMERRKEIMDWLRDNGINPDDTFMVAWVDEGLCVAGMYDKNEEGKRFLNLGGQVSIHDQPFTPTTPPPWVRWT